ANPTSLNPRAVQGRAPESDDQALELTFRSLVHALRALDWQDQMSPGIRVVDYYRNNSLSTNPPITAPLTSHQYQCCRSHSFALTRPAEFFRGRGFDAY